MAEEKVILSLVLNADEVQEGISRTANEASKLRDRAKEIQGELNKLKKEGKDNTDSFKNLTTELANVKAELTAVTREQRTYTSIVTNTKIVNDAETGSLIEKRAALSAMKATYALASEEQKKFDQSTIKLGNDIGELTREIQDEEQLMGEFFRNVGNYPQTLENLSLKLKDLQDKLDSLELGSDEWIKTEQQIKQVQREIDTAGSAFGKFGTSLDKTIKNVEGVGKAVNGGVAAFQLMQVVQSKNEATNIAMEKAMRAVAIMQATQNAIAGVSAVIELASNATKAVKIALLETEVAKTRGLTAATYVQATAQAVLNAIMSANPVMLIVAGIGALIAAFAIFSGSTKSASEKQDELNQKLEGQVEAMKRAQQATQNMQSDRINLMKAQGKSESEILAQQIADFDANNKTQTEIYAKNKELQLGLLKKYQLEEDEEKKKEYKKQYDDQVIANNQQLAELQRYGTQRQVLLAEQATAEADAARKSADLAISAMASGHAKQLAQLKSQRENDIAEAKGNEQDIANIKQDYANQEAELRKGWAKEAYDKKSADLDKEIQLQILKTKEGTEERLLAEREGIIKRRDFDLKETGITENAKKLITQQSVADLKAIDDQITANKQQQTEDILALERNKVTRTLEINKLNASNDQERLNASIQLIQNGLNNELIAIENASDEKKLKAQQEITDATVLAETIRAIDDQTAQNKVLATQKAAIESANVLKEYTTIQFEESQANLEFEISQYADGTIKKLELQLKYLDDQYKNEIDAANKLGKDTTLITKKYEAGKNKILEDSTNFQLQQYSSAFGQAASLFKQNTTAYKATATAQAIIDTYLAASKTLSAFSGVPIPGYAIIQVGATIASGLMQVAKINGVQFYDGGFSDKGGYTGSGNPRDASNLLGIKPYTYHKREYIAPAWVVESPVGRQYVDALEQIRVGRSLNTATSSISGFFNGGFSPDMTMSANSSVVDVYTLENSLSRSISNMPNPVVFVEDINSGQNTVAMVQSRANI
jgi:hypothetical protein